MFFCSTGRHRSTDALGWFLHRQPLGKYETLYPLVMTNIAMVKPWPIEIDGLPFLKMVIFHGKLLNNQMVNNGIFQGIFIG